MRALATRRLYRLSSYREREEAVVDGSSEQRVEASTTPAIVPTAASAAGEEPEIDTNAIVETMPARLSRAAFDVQTIIIAVGVAVGITVAAVVWHLPTIFVSPDTPGAKSISSPAFEIFKLILDKGVLALVLAGFTFWITRALDRHKAALTLENDLRKEERQDLLDQHQRERDELDRQLRNERERTYVARTQLDIECRFFGPEEDKIIADIRLIAENKGGSIRGFRRMTFRIAAMLEGQSPTTYAARDGLNRLSLTGERIKEATAEGFTFSIEPGVKQTFPLSTLIDARARYLSVKVEIDTHEWGQPGTNWLAEERLFPVVLEPGPPAS